jgi:hypothetical protein
VAHESGSCGCSARPCGRGGVVCLGVGLAQRPRGWWRHPDPAPTRSQTPAPDQPGSDSNLTPTPPTSTRATCAGTTNADHTAPSAAGRRSAASQTSVVSTASPARQTGAHTTTPERSARSFKRSPSDPVRLHTLASLEKVRRACQIPQKTSAAKMGAPVSSDTTTKLPIPGPSSTASRSPARARQ